MRCPNCGEKLIVQDSYDEMDGTRTRVRLCLGCGSRFQTCETIAAKISKCKPKTLEHLRKKFGE